MNGAHIKVTGDTKRLIELAARISDMPMAALVDKAVIEYLQAHRAEIEQGIENCKTVLGLLDAKTP